MRKLLLALASTALLLATATARADLLEGILQVGGGSSVINITNTNPLTGTIGFVPGSSVLTAINGTSGDFVPFIGQAVNFPSQGSPPTQLDFNTLFNDNPFLVVNGLTFTLTTENTPMLVG